ncbi:DUF3800 domain-containing protein [Clostridium perfringens]|uniref:DUF3800 domain-containing protein n=1 Tax=Clostridium perfringens TaxID=1502 RepID=UPI00285C51BA|nr:DUF3800 domain-containing protein [Clostridium perfringens]MDM0848417.1 DUF3800 domain-containing protein [Clostridium perfringens]
MDYNIYLDESGNTGDIKYNKDKEVWNYDTQKYFALGSITIAKNKVRDLENDIKDIFNKYDKELGLNKELKSTSKPKYRNELLSDLIEKLSEYESSIYIDISNKKYKIMVYIVEYCIYPYYLLNESKYLNQNKIDCNNLATNLYNTLSDEFVSKFIELCLEDKKEDKEKINMLISFIDELKDKIKNPIDKDNAEKVKQILKRYEEYGLKIENIFPIKDKTNKGSTITFLPNIDAYLNIVASVSTFNIGQNDKLNIFHDNQKQFDKSISLWTTRMREELIRSNVKNVEFLDSKENILVQVIDFITGLSLKCYKECMGQRYLKKNTRDLIKILKPVLRRCNIVTDRSEEYKFETNLNIKLSSTPMPMGFKY